MIDEKILFVMEGEKDDPKFLKRLIKAYEKELELPESSAIVIYAANIYSLYEELNSLENEDGVFVDIVGLLKERNQGKNEKILEGYTQDSFSRIYLFFDLDIHGQPLEESYSKLQKMSKKFDNETENGKLYISYPMIESVCICDKNEGLLCDDRKLFPVKNCLNDGFKKFTKSVLHSRSSFQTFEKDDWDAICRANYTKANWIINKKTSIPDSNDFLDMEQNSILQKEIDFIEQDNAIATLSAYPFWLKEIMGNNFALKMFQKLPDETNS